MEIGLIAPCGINCGVCKGYLRARNRCHGCRYADQNKPETRLHCRLRMCEQRTGQFCYDCDKFPCTRLRQLDKRYRTRYGMSEIENLELIRDKGIEQFLQREKDKWISEKGVLCVHDKQYYADPVSRTKTGSAKSSQGALPGPRKPRP